MADWNCTLNCSLGPDEEYISFRNQTRFWIQRVLVPIITVIGVLGNSITIMIMSRRRMRSSTNHYLAALGVVDMLYLIFSFILSLSHYPDFHDIKYYSYWMFRPFILMLVDTCSNTSVWLTVTFTVERYIAVCHPMKGKILCTESRAKKAIFSVFLICFTFTVPTPFEHKIDESKLPYLDLTHSALGNNPLYRSIFYWLTTILFIFLPLILLAIFNSFLIRSLHTSKVRRKTMTRRNDNRDASRQERKITIMLVSVVILFFICQLPTATVLIYQTFHEIPRNSNEDIIFEILGNVFNFLMGINAAGNFVLYCVLSQKYRTTFLQTFCPCLKGRIYHLHSVYQNTLYTSNGRDSPQVSHKTLSLKEENGKVSMDQNTNLREYSGSWKGKNPQQVVFRGGMPPRESDCNL